MSAQAFETWWTEHGQFCRAGGGDYEKTFAFRAFEFATERAAKEALKFSVSSHMMLHAGECTAGQFRTGKAIANGIAAAIRARGEG